MAVKESPARERRRKAEEAADAKGRWLTSAQRKGIGKWLKPWGKQPTGVTFWVQVIANVVVVVVALGNAAAMGFRNPTLLTLIIVVVLFCLALLYGYWQARKTQKREELAIAAAALENEEVEEVEEDDEVVEKSAELTDDSEEGKARKAEEAEAAQDSLQKTIQRVQEEAKTTNVSEEETAKRVEAIGEMYNGGLQEGVPPAQVAERCGQLADQMKEHDRQLRLREKDHQTKLQEMYKQCRQQGVPDDQAKARVKMTDELVREEWGARQEAQEACQRVHMEAMQQGASPEEAQQRVQSCSEAFRIDFSKKMEDKKVALMKKHGVGNAPTPPKVDPEVAALLRARVKVTGLVGRPELNGCAGVAASFVKDKGRFKVIIDDTEEQVLLKPNNLIKIEVEEIEAEVEEIEASTPVEDDPPPLE